MSMLALSSITVHTDIAGHIRLLVDTLNLQYPLRRVEMEFCPSTFCQQLIEESPQSLDRRSKAPTTMSRSLFDSIFEAATRCINGDTSSSVAKFDGLSLRHFRLDSSYPSSLFFDNKVVVPHDAVFLVLYHLHAYALLGLSDLNSLVFGTCTFIPLKTIRRFLSVVRQTAAAAVPAAPQPTPAPPIRMSTFGINLTGTISSLSRTASRKLLSTKPQDVRVTPDSAGAQGQHSFPQPPQPPHPTTKDQGSSRPPAARLTSKKPTYTSSPVRDLNDSSPPSPSSPSLAKRLFVSETSSARYRKKTRIVGDTSNKTPGAQQVIEASKTVNKPPQRAHKSTRKNKKRNMSPKGRNQMVSPQTSPITKNIPGSFLLRGERLEGHLA